MPSLRHAGAFPAPPSPMGRLALLLAVLLGSALLGALSSDYAVRALLAATHIDALVLAAWCAVYAALVLLASAALTVAAWLLRVLLHTVLGDVRAQRYERVGEVGGPLLPVLLAVWCSVVAVATLSTATFAALDVSLLVPEANGASYGDVRHYRYALYPGELGAVLPRRVFSLSTREAKFNSEKIVMMLKAMLEGANNALEEALTRTRSRAHPDDYASAFHSPSLRARLPRLAQQSQWLSDMEYAAQWTRGINPLTLTRLRVWPSALRLTAAHEAYVEHVLFANCTTLARLLQEQKLFLADSSILETVAPWRDCVRYAALVVFYIDEYTGDRPHLMPLAIQLTRGREVVVELPPSPRSVRGRPLGKQSNEAFVRWTLAKMHAVSADGQVHEMEHAWNHLFLEPVIVALFRQLNATHPVYRLLKPHVRHTLAINELGRKTLLEPDGFFDSLTAVGAAGTLELLAQTIEAGYNFTAAAFPDHMAARGFAEVRDGQSDPLPGYLYRDYGFLVWRAIEAYVAKVVAREYAHDHAVTYDVSLQRWATEIASPAFGNLRGFPARVESMAQLVHLLTHFIFSATAQHSSCSSQFDYYGFVPNRPLCLTKPMPPPTTRIDWAYVMAALPNHQRSMLQISIANTLSMRPTRPLQPSHKRQVVMLVRKVLEWLSLDETLWEPTYTREFDEFIRDLSAAEETMKRRNRLSGYTYEYLYADAIPLSVDI